jgi:hypothetical protein
MPDVVEFKPVGARRPHRSVRPKLLNIKGLDRRTAARKAFDALVAEIEHDLGGREQLSAIEKSLIQAYAGSAILLDDLNARVVLGQEIDVGTYAQVTSALVRIASRLGLQRRQRDVTPTVEEYLRNNRHSEILKFNRAADANTRGNGRRTPSPSSCRSRTASARSRWRRA